MKGTGVGVDKLTSAEKTLGVLLPQDYRDFLTTPENAGSEIVARFHAPGCVDWSQDFPFTADTPVYCDPLTDNPATWEDNTLAEEATKPLYEQLMRGIVFLAEEGYGEWSVLVLRGAARGQVWALCPEWWTGMEAYPRRHPVTGEILGFAQWRILQHTPLKFLHLTKRERQGLMCRQEQFSALWIKAAHQLIASGEVTGITAKEVSGIRRKADVPEAALFRDPRTGDWFPLARATVVEWAKGNKVLPVWNFPNEEESEN
ncbi:MAG: SMI1/KNR4 family protein [Corynebacterium sp.]|uniref:SMI1/KNR4 family protein n=1 Tax=Corynebacterium sp. TaxID=1720 RepID=UPI0026DD1ED5|nr:SMI1/KNR4 family protein [Corynebacterium sp.]MDO5098342.1 SMI1/KNR4 family protein [Corynebacterium sp.]